MSNPSGNALARFRADLKSLRQGGELAAMAVYAVIFLGVLCSLAVLWLW